LSYSPVVQRSGNRKQVTGPMTFPQAAHRARCTVTCDLTSVT